MGNRSRHLELLDRDPVAIPPVLESGGADLRRWPRRVLHAASARHPGGEAGAGDVLRRRRARGASPRARPARTRHGSRHRQSFPHPLAALPFPSRARFATRDSRLQRRDPLGDRPGAPSIPLAARSQASGSGRRAARAGDGRDRLAGARDGLRAAGSGANRAPHRGGRRRRRCAPASRRRRPAGEHGPLGHDSGPPAGDRRPARARLHVPARGSAVRGGRLPPRGSGEESHGRAGRLARLSARRGVPG